MLLRPSYVFESIADITPQFLEKENIHALILDLDNTLTTHNNPVPKPEIRQWLNGMKAVNFKMIILSNNHYERVKPFADELGLDFVCNGGKPLTGGYKRAVERLGIDKRYVASVGDQIYTDVLGCSLAGIRSIFTFPIVYEAGFWFRIKRTLEKPFFPRKSKIIKERNDV